MFVHHDLFRAVLDIVHLSDPFHLIGGLERLGHAFLLGYLPDDELHAIFAG